MAYCQKCGAQVDDAAAFCSVCGAGQGPAATAPPKGRPGKFVWIAAAVVLLAVLGAGIPLGLGYLADKREEAAAEALEERMRDQAETVADFLEGIVTGDYDLVRGAAPSRYADEIIDDHGDDEWYDVERDWADNVLEMTFDDGDEVVRVSIEADGGDTRGEVEIGIVFDGDRETESAVVELEDDRWVVVEWFGENFEDEYGREGSAQQACFDNQRNIEGVVAQWLAYDQDRGTWELQGEVDWEHPFFDTDSPEEPYFNDVPVCPTTDAYYYLDEYGETGCPEHGHYSD